MKLLLVDDDPAIVALLLPLLKRAPGFDTTVACDGSAAIQNAALARGVDLLITDVVMEPMDGFTLNQQLRATYPAMKTIFISGYDLREYAAQTEGCIVLSKPINPEDLLAAIAQIIPAGLQPMDSDGSSEDSVTKSIACIGNYQILKKIGAGTWGPVYLAVQSSMGRTVAMKVLAPEVQEKVSEAKQRFLATARAQAAVKHTAILSVYEAGEADGQTYYTYEYAQGAHLEDLYAIGKKIDDRLALRIIKVVAQGLSYLHQQGIPHAELTAQRIYLDKDGTARLANLAVYGRAEEEIHGSVAALARILTLLLPGGAASDPGLTQMLSTMAREGSAAYPSWSAVEEAAKALELKVTPSDAIKLTAQEQAAIRAVEQAKRQQNRSLLLTIAVILGLLCLAACLLWWNYHRAHPAIRGGSSRSADPQMSLAT
jgi:CheY-like chemotaxis protein